MSSPYQQPPHPQPAYPAAYGPPAPPPSNGLGTAGFIVSLVGLLVTCGVLCPLGLLLSLIALIKPPRGMAIAGTIIGLIGTAVLAAWLLAFVVFAVAAKTGINYVQTAITLQEARDVVQTHINETGEVPDGIEGNRLIVDQTDAWGNAIRYDRLNGEWLVRSAGPDGQYETDDDLTAAPGRDPVPPDVDDDLQEFFRQLEQHKRKGG